MANKKWLKYNHQIKSGETRKENEVKDGYLGRIQELTDEQIQSTLYSQLQRNITAEDFEDRQITRGCIEPLDYYDDLYDKKITIN